MQGIYTAELVETEHLGLLLGVQQAFYGIAGAAGPIVAGALLTATGSWTSTLLLTAVAFAAAALVLGPGSADRRQAAASLQREHCGAGR